MKRKHLTGSRSPSRRRPPLFSGSPVLARVSGRAGAARAVPGALPSPGPRARRHRPRPVAATCATTHPRRQARRRSRSRDGRLAGRARPPHAGTPADRALGSSIPLAWANILPARQDNACQALRCPQKRGHSKKTRGLSSRFSPTGPSSLLCGGALGSPGAEVGCGVSPVMASRRSTGGDATGPRPAAAGRTGRAHEPSKAGFLPR